MRTISLFMTDIRCKEQHQHGAGLVITDFRAIPILAVVDIARREKNPLLLVSQASMRQGDYGDGVSPRLRLLLVRTLRMFFPVAVVSGSKTLSKDHQSCDGCMTSLISRTHDSKATPERYSTLWKLTNELCEGAETVGAEVERLGLQRIYVFNGRLASVRPLTRLSAGETGLLVFFYEFGASNAEYRLVSFPLHDFQFSSELLRRFAKKIAFNFDKSGARAFIKKKLANRFNSDQESISLTKYKTVIFSGSPHEYTRASDNSTYIDADVPAMVKKAAENSGFTRPAALRLHPNSIEDKNYGGLRTSLEITCASLGIDLIGADDLTSTNDLIKNADNVMVGGSSVALDAFFLGRKPTFLGDNYYRGLIEELEKRFPEDSLNLFRLASAVEGFRRTQVVQLPLGMRVIPKFWSLSSRVSRNVRFGLSNPTCSENRRSAGYGNNKARQR